MLLNKSDLKVTGSDLKLLINQEVTVTVLTYTHPVDTCAFFSSIFPGA